MKGRYNGNVNISQSRALPLSLSLAETFGIYLYNILLSPSERKKFK